MDTRRSRNGSRLCKAIGPQIVHPQPAAIVTLGVRTKVPRSVHTTGALVCWRHGIGPLRGRWRRLAGRLFTQRTVRLVRQARKGFGLDGTLALGLRWRGWGRRAWLGPSDVQHDEEPHESEEGELVVKKMRDHGLAPSKRVEMGAFYRVLWLMELAAEFGYTTSKRYSGGYQTR